MPDGSQRERPPKREKRQACGCGGRSLATAQLVSPPEGADSGSDSGLDYDCAYTLRAAPTMSGVVPTVFCTTQGPLHTTGTSLKRTLRKASSGSLMNFPSSEFGSSVPGMAK
eukprot:389191-Prorocentrum_minimum.AAC.1